MMKAILGIAALAAILLLGSITFSVGQGSPQPAWVGDVLADYDCLPDHTICGNDYTGCVSLTITVPQAGDYVLAAWVECSPPEPDCGGCYACAHLLDGNTDLAAVQTLCTSPCDWTSGHIALIPGVSYKLVVCKKPCDNNRCDGCNTHCAAMAQVRGA